MSETNPENGTTSYTYNGVHEVTSRTDAKGQQTQHSYDSYNRLTEVRHLSISGQLQEDPSQRWDYYYDTNTIDTSFPAQNTWGRLTAVQFQPEGTFNYYGAGLGQMTYEYSYNPAGRVTTQRLQLANAASAHLDATYAWDNEGRVTSLAYPLSGPTYAYAFDAMGRLSTMTENGSQMAVAGYNWADQIRIQLGRSDDVIDLRRLQRNAHIRSAADAAHAHPDNAGRQRDGHELPLHCGAEQRADLAIGGRSIGRDGQLHLRRAEAARNGAGGQQLLG